MATFDRSPARDCRTEYSKTIFGHCRAGFRGVGQHALRDVRDADGFFGMVSGCPPDEGVMLEPGMAIAWQNLLFLFRDAFRRTTASDFCPSNLTVCASLRMVGRGRHRYASVADFTDPDQAGAAGRPRRRGHIWLIRVPAGAASQKQATFRQETRHASVNEWSTRRSISRAGRRHRKGGVVPLQACGGAACTVDCRTLAARRVGGPKACKSNPRVNGTSGLRPSR